MNIFFIELLFSLGLTFFELARFQQFKKYCPANEKNRLCFNTALRMLYIFIWLFVLYPYLVVGFLWLVIPKMNEALYSINLINMIFYLIATPFIILYSRKAEQKGFYPMGTQLLCIPLTNILIAAECFNLAK